MASAPPSQQQQQPSEQEEKKKQIWNMATYGLMVADPFIEGTELELGHVAQSASVLGFLLHKLLTNRTSRDRLSLFSDG